jgi:hypothetical protein
MQRKRAEYPGGRRGKSANPALLASLGGPQRTRAPQDTVQTPPSGQAPLLPGQFSCQ